MSCVYLPHSFLVEQADNYVLEEDRKALVKLFEGIDMVPTVSLAEVEQAAQAVERSSIRVPLQELFDELDAIELQAEAMLEESRASVLPRRAVFQLWSHLHRSRAFMAIVGRELDEIEHSLSHVICMAPLAPFPVQS